MNVHEMLGAILLTMCDLNLSFFPALPHCSRFPHSHNCHHYFNWFASIRASIADGSFDSLRAAFLQKYTRA